MKIPDLSIIEKTLNNEATSEESCEVVRWFKTPEGQAWLAERIDQDEKTIHMGEEEAWIDPRSSSMIITVISGSIHASIFQQSKIFIVKIKNHRVPTNRAFYV